MAITNMIALKDIDAAAINVVVKHLFSNINSKSDIDLVWSMLNRADNVHDNARLDALGIVVWAPFERYSSEEISDIARDLASSISLEMTKVLK